MLALDSDFVFSGFVTTTTVTYGTPSALYAHSPDTWWQADRNVPAGQRHCKDIARQLVEDSPGKNINVRRNFDPKNFFPCYESRISNHGDTYDRLH
jgi:alkaline phosphatase